MRDLDPDTYSGTEDLLLEVGSVSVAKELGLALDSYWTAKFTLSKEAGNLDVYSKPVEAASFYTERKPLELGYWSSFFRWKDNDMKVLTHPYRWFRMESSTEFWVYQFRKIIWSRCCCQMSWIREEGLLYACNDQQKSGRIYARSFHRPDSERDQQREHTDICRETNRPKGL